MIWTHWPLDRFLVLFVSLAFLLIGIQVAMSHYRQNFHHKTMWVPVVEAPIFMIVSGALALTGVDWLMTLFLACMWLGVLTGLAGTYLHLRGVGIRVGGYEFRNFLMGPPVIMPILYAAVSVLGLAAGYWR